MLSNIFLGLSLIGAEWVLYLLLVLSIVSIALIVERLRFYREARKGIDDFRQQVRQAVEAGRLQEAATLAEERKRASANRPPDLESEMTWAMLSHARAAQEKQSSLHGEVLGEVAHDAVTRAKLRWEQSLSILATIGANSPFVGLFGTVLGIIKAFHDLSQQAGTGAQGVTAGISEALVATAVGLLVAIPAVVAFNIFQRRVKAALGEAEALKSFLVGKLAR